MSDTIPTAEQIAAAVDTLARVAALACIARAEADDTRDIAEGVAREIGDMVHRGIVRAVLSLPAAAPRAA